MKRLNKTSMQGMISLYKSSELKIIQQKDGCWQIHLEHEKTNSEYVLADTELKVRKWKDPSRAISYMNEKLGAKKAQILIKEGI